MVVVNKTLINATAFRMTEDGERAALLNLAEMLPPTDWFLFWLSSASNHTVHSFNGAKSRDIASKAQYP